ncbi:zf-HC2 domain-containing protein [Amycolatopsis albispora]|uniref:Putative zinc-finger domain-containing protein n=1 Tax=Amycolatopsis albispora TaxID=1804986 RepID=A0A344L0N0_9PSEU|nr:zf-HC2 domain-containing protein [Amycolatopsis albispora]AXB41604.1 hypothetical protein A4R43_02925 [Amycolatopsis albispora]
MSTEEPTDAWLLDAVRAGNLIAYGVLFQRHSEPARELAAGWLVGPDGVHELISDAFTRVLTALRRGAGPREDLRASLVVTMGHLASRPEREETASPEETVVRRWYSQLADPVFRQLSPRSRLALWHLDLDPAPAGDLAAVLGLSPADIPELVHQARDELHQAYLRTQAPRPRAEDCAPARQQLSAWVRGALSCRPSRRVENHLAECPGCLTAAVRLLGSPTGVAASHTHRTTS